MLDLGILERLVDRLDQTAGHVASFNSLTQASVDFFSVSLLISALSA
jgi:hypothetical protein